jgi:nitronate monooxygenase
MIPGGLDFTPSSAQLTTLDRELTAAREYLGLPAGEPLPVGVGFLLFHDSAAAGFVESAVPLLRRHRPRAVWLFAPPSPSEGGDGGEGEGNGDGGGEGTRGRSGEEGRNVISNIISALHAQDIIVFFQIGNVAAARQAVRDGADVIVAQGVDAGGHQFARGSGVVSLVPEVVDMVEREFPERGVVVVAAGGIVEGRGVAAALVLGEFSDGVEYDGG